MRVLVLVEGDSDKATLDAVLRPRANDARVGIDVVALGGKDALLHRGPRVAASRMVDEPSDHVFVVPDLYPMARYDGTQDAHGSAEELRNLLTRRFHGLSKHAGLGGGAWSHFHAHVLKHDLEALCLAAPAGLAHRLRAGRGVTPTWRVPVEEQNDDEPPRRVVEKLFKKHLRRRYADVVDAPVIVGGATVESLVQGCPEGFGMLVQDLERVLRQHDARRGGRGSADAE